MTTQTLVQNGGGNHILIMAPTMPPDSIGQGSHVYAENAAYLYLGYGQTSNTIGDNFSWNAYFSGGIYTLTAIMASAANRGIAKIQIDGVTVNGDGYDTNIAAAYINFFTTTNISISEGVHTITLLINTKTGTNYLVVWDQISFERIA